MLSSFVGTFDSRGLRTLRYESEYQLWAKRYEDGQKFWAVVESDILPSIQFAIANGDRHSALALLAEKAISAGRI